MVCWARGTQCPPLSSIDDEITSVSKRVNLTYVLQAKSALTELFVSLNTIMDATILFCTNSLSTFTVNVSVRFPTSPSDSRFQLRLLNQDQHTIVESRVAWRGEHVRQIQIQIQLEWDFICLDVDGKGLLRHCSRQQQSIVFCRQCGRSKSLTSHRSQLILTIFFPRRPAVLQLHSAARVSWTIPLLSLLCYLSPSLLNCLLVTFTQPFEQHSVFSATFRSIDPSTHAAANSTSIHVIT